MSPVVPNQPHHYASGELATNKPTLQLPFWALVSFGAFVLLRLGWGMFTFNDVPEAHQELMAEIELAKKDLRTLGVDVD